MTFYDYKLNSKNNTYVLNFSEFFRFDLNTFKTKKCTKECNIFFTQKSMTKASASSIIASTTTEGPTSKIMDIFCAKNQNNNVVKIYNAHTLITKSSNSIILVGTKANSVKITTSPKRTPTQKTLLSSHPVLLASFVHSRMMILRFLFNSSTS